MINKLTCEAAAMEMAAATRRAKWAAAKKKWRSQRSSKTILIMIDNRVRTHPSIQSSTKMIIIHVLIIIAVVIHRASVDACECARFAICNAILVVGFAWTAGHHHRSSPVVDCQFVMHARAQCSSNRLASGHISTQSSPEIESQQWLLYPFTKHPFHICILVRLSFRIIFIIHNQFIISTFLCVLLALSLVRTHSTNIGCLSMSNTFNWYRVLRSKAFQPPKWNRFLMKLSARRLSPSRLRHDHPAPSERRIAQSIVCLNRVTIGSHALPNTINSGFYCESVPFGKWQHQNPSKGRCTSDSTFDCAVVRRRSHTHTFW